MRLFTGIGDYGTSGLYKTSERFSKDDPIYHALGDIDELNSSIGLCRALARVDAHIPDDHARFEKILLQAQECLFIVQAELAGADKVLTRAHVQELESDIAYIAQYVKIPKAFVIPGTTVLSAHFDLARTIARRAERSLVTAHARRPICAHALAYLNRISSLLYAYARSLKDASTEQENNPSYT